MAKYLLLVFFSIGVVSAQTRPDTLTNEIIIKMVQAGVPAPTIISTIQAAESVRFDMLESDQAALVRGGVPDTVFRAMAAKSLGRPVPGTNPQATSTPAQVAATSTVQRKASSPTQPSTATQPPPPPLIERAAPTQSVAQEPAQTSLDLTQGSQPRSVFAADLRQTPNQPRVFLQAASKGTNRNAARDQAMEMSKDVEKDCPGVRVTINPQAADYTVLLNHIEVGLFVRDNQVQVANKNGDLISRTKEGGSIAGGMKRACEQILSDWAKK